MYVDDEHYIYDVDTYDVDTYGADTYGADTYGARIHDTNMYDGPVDLVNVELKQWFYYVVIFI